MENKLREYLIKNGGDQVHQGNIDILITLIIKFIEDNEHILQRHKS